MRLILLIASFDATVGQIELTSARVVRSKLTTVQFGYPIRQSGPSMPWSTGWCRCCRTLQSTALSAHCNAGERQRSDRTSDIVISWEAGRAARDLGRLSSSAPLDELRDEIARGGPTRITNTGKWALWGTGKAPKSISIPDNPARAAAKLWV